MNRNTRGNDLNTTFSDKMDAGDFVISALIEHEKLVDENVKELGLIAMRLEEITAQLERVVNILEKSPAKPSQ